MSKGMLRRLFVAGSAAALITGALTVAEGKAQASGLGFGLHVVGQYGGEPSLTSDSTGVLYASSPSGPTTFRSSNAGVTWTQIQSPDTASGDTCLNTDSENSLYWCNLAGTVSTLPLQADVFKSTNPPIHTCVANCSWQYGLNATVGTTGGTSSNPFGVDRQWVASYITPGQHTNNAEVVLMYHDFYGPSHIWVNISTDGGQHFGAAQEVLSESTPGSNLIAAEGYTFCNTVPLGVGIAQPGTPHAGRIYVAWISADPVADAQGCNVTQNEAFHTAWISYSDGNGASGTWHPQLAFDAGEGRDLSTPFASFTLDDQGNPYIAFNSEPPADLTTPAGVAGQLLQPITCAVESITGTGLQTDSGCSYNTYVVWSPDGGDTWNGGGGSLGGSLVQGAAAHAILASPADTTIGTDQFATIAAGDPGQVDVSWLHTSENEPQGNLAFGKFDPLGCAGPGTGLGPVYPPPTFPPTCEWNLWASQSLNLNAATPVFTSAQLTGGANGHATHYGDICNLGIACFPTTTSGQDPRHLLDFNMETIDPTTGCAHIAFADDNAANTAYADPHGTDPTYGNHVVSADQTVGCLTLTQQPSTALPESPATPLLVGSGVVAAAAVGVAVRRRRRIDTA